MRDETFSIPFDRLVRRVVPRKGAIYEHVCTKQVYDDVAFAIELEEGGAFTGEEIRSKIDAPFTQVVVAMAFLKERGCIKPVQGRRFQAACATIFEDAMIEWHALREGSPGSAAAHGDEA